MTKRASRCEYAVAVGAGRIVGTFNYTAEPGKNNTLGMHNDWNPDVTCAYA